MDFHNIIDYIKGTIINIYLTILSFIYFLFGIKKDSLNKKEGFGGAVGKKINDLKKKVNKYKNEVTNIGNKVTGYTNIVTNYTNNVKDYGNQVSDYANKIGGLKKDITTYGNKISGLKNDITNYGNQMSGYTNKISGFKDKISDLGTKITDLGTKIGGVVVDTANITKDKLLEFANKLKGIIQDLALGRLETLIKIAIRPLIKDLVNTITSLINNTVLKPYEVLKKSVVLMFTEIKDSIAKLTMVPDLISGFTNKIKDFFVNLGSTIEKSIVKPINDVIKNVTIIFMSIFEILLIIINKIIEVPDCMISYTYMGMKYFYNEKIRKTFPGIFVFIADITINVTYLLSRPIVLSLNYYNGYDTEKAVFEKYQSKCLKFDFKQPLDKMKKSINGLTPNFIPLKLTLSLDEEKMLIKKILENKVEPVEIDKDNDIYSVPLDISKMNSSINQKQKDEIELDKTLEVKLKDEIDAQYKRQDEEAKKLKGEQLVLQKATKAALVALNSAKDALNQTKKAKKIANSGLKYTKEALKEAQKVYNVAIANLKYAELALEESKKALEIAIKSLEKSKKMLKEAEKALRAAIDAAKFAAKEAERLAKEAAAAAEAAAKAAAEAAKREAERIAREAAAAAKAAAEAVAAAKREAERKAREAVAAAKREAERKAAETAAATAAAAASAGTAISNVGKSAGGAIKKVGKVFR